MVKNSSKSWAIESRDTLRTAAAILHGPKANPTGPGGSEGWALLLQVGQRQLGMPGSEGKIWRSIAILFHVGCFASFVPPFAAGCAAHSLTMMFTVSILQMRQRPALIIRLRSYHNLESLLGIPKAVGGLATNSLPTMILFLFDLA